MTDVLPASDAAKVVEHERLLQFDAFDETTAWELGTRIRTEALSMDASVLIDIRIADHCVFSCALPGTGPDNADWARRKRNLVNLLHTSSYAIALQVARGEDPLGIRGLHARDYAPAGGCFPIRVKGVGFIGTATVSGLPMREDHKLVVNAIAAMLNVELGDSKF